MFSFFLSLVFSVFHLYFFLFPSRSFPSSFLLALFLLPLSHLFVFVSSPADLFLLNFFFCLPQSFFSSPAGLVFILSSYLFPSIPLVLFLFLSQLFFVFLPLISFPSFLQHSPFFPPSTLILLVFSLGLFPFPFFLAFPFSFSQLLFILHTTFTSSSNPSHIPFSFPHSRSFPSSLP